MTALTQATAPMSAAQAEWLFISADAPQLATSARRYVAQIELSQRPNTVLKADEALRSLSRHLVEHHPEVRGFADVSRLHIESFKLALGEHRTAKGTPYSAASLRQRLGMVHSFFERICEWGWEDAPARVPLHNSDLPRPIEPLPKALDDAAAAKFMQALAAEKDPRRRLCVEILARAGLRVGELCELRDDAVAVRDGAHWLRVPVGKLRNDRVVPLLEPLIGLLESWQARHDNGGTGLLITTDGRPLNRHAVTRMVNSVAKRAGIGHVHPHRLRHTLATQAINRGMRLEAIAELLGHKTLRMALCYARIANKTVADEYRQAADRVEALYAQPDDLPETPAMKRLRREHRRMLGNGWCTRPAAMDCSFEALCEGCGFFATSVEFKPTLERQRDHATEHGQPTRQAIYERLLERVEETGT